MSKDYNRFSIKPYDATKYLRQMKYLPDVTPYCGVLLFVLTLFMSGFMHPRLSSGSSFRLPEAKYAHQEPLASEKAPCIKMHERGGFSFEEKFCTNIDDLPTVFNELLKEKNFKAKCNKILLQIDEDLSWGKICDVMKFLKTNKIKVIGLITHGSTSFVDYYEQQRLYKEKGIRVPDSAL